MRRLSFRGVVLAVTFVALAVACGSDPASRTPTFPSAPTVLGVNINGPSTVPPGQSAQFTADVRLSNGTVKPSVSGTSVRWRTSNASAMQVSASGLATAGQDFGDAVLTAEVLPNATIRSTKEVVILPDGTYRVTGAVRDADLFVGIAGARVEVSGTPVAATADATGNYRLYGVPPSAVFRVLADGYQTLTQSVQLTAHTSRSFTLQPSSRLSLNGPFLVSVDVVGTCSGTPALPEELRHRTYEANVTTSGASVNVQLTEPRFKIQSGYGNRFFGRAGASSIAFTIGAGYYSFYYGYFPDLIEQLSNNTYLMVYGTASTTPAGGGMSGTMNGGFTLYDSRYPALNAAVLGRCSSTTGLRLTLTPR